MRNAAAVFGASLLLAVLITATIAIADFYHPPIPPAPVSSTSTITALTSHASSSPNRTDLFVRLAFANGTLLRGALLSAGPYLANSSTGTYEFPKIQPGNLSLLLSARVPAYLPPAEIDVLTGTNYANVTVYPLSIFTLILNNGLDINGSQPGPPIQAKNSTAVRLVIRNNTTLIHNIAVSNTLDNISSSNILFSSLSITLNAGGSTNDTFIVTNPGEYYYVDLIGNHAKDGEYGAFLVLP